MWDGQKQHQTVAHIYTRRTHSLLRAHTKTRLSLQLWDPVCIISALRLHMIAALLWWLALGLIVLPFLTLPWESQSGSTDESYNKSAAKADAGHDLICFHYQHYQRASYRTIQQALKWTEHRNHFSLVCKNNGDATMVMYFSINMIMLHYNLIQQSKDTSK